MCLQMNEQDRLDRDQNVDVIAELSGGFQRDGSSE